MRKYFVYSLWVLAIVLVGCNSGVKKHELVGAWDSEEEKCDLRLNEDFTFKATNLPLDVGKSILPHIR